ncbi:unnamed protein product [Urochloa humidicola]
MAAAASAPQPWSGGSWADLDAGPASLIADRLLSEDVRDYVRFRAVCGAWRACCADPRTHAVSVFDRRFHPRRWIMLPLASNAGTRRRFLNVDTGERILVGLQEYRRYCVLGPTAEGLVVLCRKDDYIVQLLNPLTAQLTDLPDATTLLDPSKTNRTMDQALNNFRILSAGLADEYSMVVLHFGGKALAMAKPGDERWTQLRPPDVIFSTLPFAGRFYCATSRNISVLDACGGNGQRRPRLVFAADHELDVHILHCAHLHLYLVDNGGEMTYVYYHYHDWRQNDLGLCRVDLNAGKVAATPGLDGHALFVNNESQSLLVPATVSPSIGADTMYVCSNDCRVVAYDYHHLGETATAKFDRQDIARHLSRYLSSLTR